MTTELKAMIHDLIRALRESGIEVPTDAARQVEVKLRMQYGGERVYISSLPKQARAVQLAKLEKCTQLQMANITGLSVRQIRRIRNGK